MSSEKKQYNKEFKIMEHAIVNHSFILDALMNILIENGICTFEDIRDKIEKDSIDLSSRYFAVLFSTLVLLKKNLPKELT